MYNTVSDSKGAASRLQGRWHLWGLKAGNTIMHAMHIRHTLAGSRHAPKARLQDEHGRQTTRVVPGQRVGCTRTPPPVLRQDP